MVFSIKNEQSRNIYTNDSFKNALNIPKNFDTDGKLDKEFPCAPCQELWEGFVEYDRKVMRENKSISYIVIHYYGKGNTDNPTPVFANKSPLCNSKNETIDHVKTIDTSALLYYIHRFNRKTIQFDAPNNLFTKRELDIIFWVLQRLSSKEIARRLDLPPRTVETKLRTIYEKAGVYSRVQFVEYCKHVGLDTYIPADLSEKVCNLLNR